MKVNKSLIEVVLTLASFVGFAFLFFALNLTGAESNLVVLSKSNTVVLSGEVNGENASQVIVRARQLSEGRFQKNKPLYLFMNTPGGSIQTGLEMIEALNGISRPVTTVSLFSASMGFQIAQGLGERLVLANGILMSHRASGQFSGNFGGKSPSQIDSRYGLWLTRLTELDKQTVKRTKGKQTLESYQNAYADELWLTGAQAVAGGYADRVVTVQCDSSLNGVNTHSITFFGFHISYDLDNCPVNTNPMNIRVDSPDEKKNILPEKAEEIKNRFLEQYINTRRAVYPMYW